MRKKVLYTLVFVKDCSKLLLGYKKRGLGEGKWNGFGGKVESGESIKQAAVRELEEECGIKTNSLNQVGLLQFEFDVIDYEMIVNVFTTKNYEGQPVETEEMKPQWFNEDKIPFKDMWPDDKFWFPLMLAEKTFSGKFYFGDMSTIKSYELKEVTEITTNV